MTHLVRVTTEPFLTSKVPLTYVINIINYVVFFFNVQSSSVGRRRCFVYFGKFLVLEKETIQDLAFKY